jgi:hypothetical protein
LLKQSGTKKKSKLARVYLNKRKQEKLANKIKEKRELVDIIRFITQASNHKEFTKIYSKKGRIKREVLKK